METEDNNKKNKKSGLYALLVIIGILLIIAGAVYTGYYMYSQYTAKQEEAAISQMAETTESNSNVSIVNNPIDFKALTSKNEEIFSWIKIKDTNINHPIVQSNVDDDFYLKHTATDKSWSAAGAVFIQSGNSKYFTDPVTVIYGHNGYGDTMFTTLHKFEDKSFFDKHEYYYIYTENSRLTVQIISAFKYDDRHIINSFDFQNLTVRGDFFKMIQNPQSTVKNVRNDLDVTIDNSSNIIVLSTCITGQKSNRYLVCGVVTENEKTN